MRRHWAGVLGASVVAASCWAAAADQTAATTAPTADFTRPGPPAAGGDHRIALTVRDLMDAIVDPSADVVWGAVGAVADQDGLRELSPQSPEAWLEVRRAAVRLVEGANLLMMSPREAAPPGATSEAPGVELEPAEITALIGRERAVFEGFAMVLQGVGVEALRAIEARDRDRLIEAGGAMEEVCESCHQTFWYPHSTVGTVNKERTR